MQIGFYYTHYQCLGHTSRIFSIVSALKQALPQTRCVAIEGSLKQKFLRSSPFFAQHSLPYPFYSRENFVRTFIAEPLAVKARAAACLALVQRLKMDAFFTEFFPFGRADCWPELLPSLIELRSKGCDIFSSAGYPVLSDGGRVRLDSVMPFYRRFYMHCPAEEVEYLAAMYPRGGGRRKYVDFFKKHANRIAFTGYIVPDALLLRNEKAEKITLPNGKVNVLVTRGAGAYSTDLIVKAIEVGDELGPDFFLTLITGPSTTEAEWKLFQAISQRNKVNNVRLVRATEQFEELIQQSDLCVCPTPYNTSALLLKYRKKAVLVPFVGIGELQFREQEARARLLQDYLGSQVIEADKLSTKSLAKAIRGAWRNPMVASVPTGWMNGREKFLNDFKRVMNKSLKD